MDVVLTGGGTGGHIYPALEVGRMAQEHGASLRYLGSIRGQESAICQRLSIPFRGFPSQPLFSLKTPAGWKGFVALLRARGMAKAELKAHRPSVVFSTGGYSAGPVVSAARALGIPYAIHTADSIPARSSAIYARQARTLTCTFRKSLELWKSQGIEAHRTGQPLRRELREAALQATEKEGDPFVLVVGGSQGSEFLNQAVPLAARRLGGAVRFLHAAGRNNYESTLKRAEGITQYEVVPYLETLAMVEAYKSATLVVSRSGGTLAEIALFGLPSIQVPLPTAAQDHQMENALEFLEMGAASILAQTPSADSAYADALAEEIRKWHSSAEKRTHAAKVLRQWDCPDATERIVGFLEQAAR